MSFHATAAAISARPNRISTLRNHLLCSVCTAMLLAGSGGMALADPVPQAVADTPSQEVPATVPAAQPPVAEAPAPPAAASKPDSSTPVATAAPAPQESKPGPASGGAPAPTEKTDAPKATRITVKSGETRAATPGDKDESFTVENGGTLNAWAGGLVKDVLVQGGKAWDAYGNGGVGGVAFISDANSHLESGSVDLGGKLAVGNKATADTVTVRNGGKLDVYNGGLVKDLAVEGVKAWDTVTGLGGIGGTAFIYGEGSRLDHGTVNVGGFLQVKDKATAGTVTVRNGGKLDVYNGGAVKDLTVEGIKAWRVSDTKDEASGIYLFVGGVGGTASISGEGSRIDHGTVDSGGTLMVGDRNKGGKGTAGDVIVRNGGFLGVVDGGNVENLTVNGVTAWNMNGVGGIGGVAGVAVEGSRINNSTINLGGVLRVSNKATTGTVTVNVGGKLDVFAEGTAETVNVNEGGNAWTAGHIGTATVAGKDSVLGVWDGGEITGKSTVRNGSFFGVLDGSKAGDIILNGGPLAPNDSYVNVDGTAGDITINGKGHLFGSGTVGNVVVHAGGEVWTGNVKRKIATLMATGDATFEKGSIFTVQIANTTSASSKLTVQGQASLLGGTVRVYAEDTEKIQGKLVILSKEQLEKLFQKSFVILEAKNGVTGKFDNVEQQANYNYITPSLAYTNTTVSVGFDLTEAAKTEKEQKLADELKQKQAEVDSLKAEQQKATGQAKVAAEAKVAEEKTRKLADELKQKQAEVDSLKAEQQKAAEQAKAQKETDEQQKVAGQAKVAADAKAAEEKTRKLADQLKQKEAEAESLKAEKQKLEEQAKAVAEAKVAEDKAKQEAAALAEAERLKIALLEERVKHLVLVDAVTPNQKSTGHAVLQLGLGNRLLQTVLFSKKGEVLAYDSLSGEAHASLRGTLLQDAGLVSGAASERVRSAFDGVAAKAAPDTTPLAYGPDVRSKDKQSAGEAFAAAAPAVSTTALWGQAYGGWSHGSSDGNAAAYNRSTGGFVTGVDALIADTWRLGVLAGYGSTSLHGAGSSLSADSYQVGLYGGTKIDALRLSFGTVLAHHEIDTRRKVSFGSLDETDTAGYSANTVHLFGEAAYRIDTPYAALEPFAAAAYTHLKTSGFTETGGIAALSAPSSTTDLTTTTLGLRASHAFTLGNATTLTARGMAGWRHAYGDVTPQAQFAFASGGESFTVSGLPVASDAALVEAGLAFDIGKATTIGLTYTGQFSSQVNDNSVKADLTVRF